MPPTSSMLKNKTIGHLVCLSACYERWHQVIHVINTTFVLIVVYDHSWLLILSFNILVVVVRDKAQHDFSF